MTPCLNGVTEIRIYRSLKNLIENPRFRKTIGFKQNFLYIICIYIYNVLNVKWYIYIISYIYIYVNHRYCWFSNNISHQTGLSQAPTTSARSLSNVRWGRVHIWPRRSSGAAKSWNFWGNSRHFQLDISMGQLRNDMPSIWAFLGKFWNYMVSMGKSMGTE